jgi:hypothetical protein
MRDQDTVTITLFSEGSIQDGLLLHTNFKCYFY